MDDSRPLCGVVGDDGGPEDGTLVLPPTPYPIPPRGRSGDGLTWDPSREGPGGEWLEVDLQQLPHE